MATTTPWNIYSPDSGSPYSLTANLGTMAASVNTAVNTVSRQSIPRVANAAGLAAIPTPEAGMMAYRADTGFTYRYDGTNWQVAFWPNVDYTTSGIVTVASGWTLEIQRGVIRSGIAFVYLAFTRTGGTISVPATGDNANTAVATLAAPWASVVPVAFVTLGSGGIGRMVQGIVTGSTVQLTATTPGGDIPNGNQLSLAGSWPVA